MGAAIVGLPDAVLGEISCACVKLKPNYYVNSETLIDFIKTRAADNKVPDKVIIVDQFPMTASGKIRKVSLQQQLMQLLKAE